MIIKVEDIPPEGLEVVFERGEKWWKEKEEFLSVDLDGPSKAKIRLKVIQEKVHVKGTIEATLRLFCARCLESFSFPLKTTMDFALVPYSLAPQKEMLRLTKDDMEIEFFDGKEINIDQIVSEQIFLNVPIKPLCKPDCAGLCPYCGKNLNKEKCNCRPVKYTPFYEALKHFIKK
ncbi:MAG TPA: DUF177 domain-containing protein [Candidatus Desulfofervidus auxilii]|uniref:DUF177 domain-containing protein n=1 Tax=Desulfofervidus auxilii TaxID=1621989 RepID=A0A7C0U1J6_DESA2|nr:DUF177 domain-containing protein [Candidatus Desulfofervidus auxilii]